MLLTLLVLYSIGLVALGLWISRRVRDSAGFFVSGRSLGAALVFATFLAPNIGAGSTVGATQLGYTYGLGAWWWNGSAGIGSLVLAFWVGPRIWREARRLNLFTVGDFLEARFGRAVRGVAAVVIWLGTLTILCAQLDGVATVLAIAGGLPHWAGCLAGAAVMTAYFTAGGLASAARVNGIQLVVKLAGFLLALPLALRAAGGWAHVAAVSAPPTLAFWSSSPAAGWPLLFLLGPAFFLSPGLLQKAYGAHDERALRRGIALNGVALMVFACVPVGLGMAARVLHPHLANPDLALATVLTDVPFAIGGLALAAVFSAELSAADAVLFMLSTSGARDLYQGFLRPQASDREVLDAARLAALVGGGLGYALTFVLPYVADALRIFYGILTVTLFVPILTGLFLPRGGRHAVLASMVTGVVVLVAVHIATAGHGVAWMSPAFIGLAASSAAYLLVTATGRGGVRS